MVSLPKHGMFDGISGRSPIAADLARRKASLANKDWGLSSEMVDFNHKNNVHIFGVHYLVGDLEHDFYFPFHIWDVILPIEKKIRGVGIPPTSYTQKWPLFHQQRL